jgi:hypothetical protein
MKTCSFRGVRPSTANKFLFCQIDPTADHEMSDCGNCGLCCPKYNIEKRGGGQPSVQFGSTSKRHQFANKYETILNCPTVSCIFRSVNFVAVVC